MNNSYKEKIGAKGIESFFEFSLRKVLWNMIDFMEGLIFRKGEDIVLFSYHIEPIGIDEVRDKGEFKRRKSLPTVV